ncbi:MAG: efflux RND transporter periplasmic adaptor subunit [Candidatus Marinimicrobia bacterium]|nr:efflux RND transporter periplasmic adaptor subunit [Candidatus Neomarinimicrobiota bacterium]
MNSTKYQLFISFISISFLILGCNKHPEDHGSHNETAQDSMVGLARSEHEDELIITLSGPEVEKAGIKLIEVGTGKIPGSRRLYGEIRLNEEQVVHKYPKYPGIVRDVRRNIGDRVFQGDTLAMVFNTSTLSTYPVIAAQSGEVLEKHAVVGEFTDGSEPLMVIGDLRTVWVDLHAFEKDMPLLKKGQALILKSIEGDEQIQTYIRYIKPVMDAITRTNIVRCTVSNTSGTWNPGRLVYAEVAYDHDGEDVLIVPESCIQTYESEHVAFVPESGSETEFAVVTVEPGQRGGGLIEIQSGLKAGDSIVSNGSFFLKSELVTSSLSGHAGHGH